MAFERIAQQKIQEAIEAGEFDHLPNAGKKLDLDEYFALPAHLRMAYSVLKSADCLPQEIELLNNVARLESALEQAPDTATRDSARAQLEAARLPLNVALDRMRADARRRL